MRVENGELLSLLGTFKNRSALVQGQLTAAKVLQILPGNVAKLSLQGEVRTALLETALQAGESYWFEVSQTEPLALKKLGAIKGGKMNSAEFVAAQLGFPKDPAARMAAQFLLTSKLPATKEQLATVADLFRISQNNEPKTAEILHQMTNRDIPLTEGTFRAMEAYEKTGPLRTELLRLLNMIDNHQPAGLLNELKQALNGVLKGSVAVSLEEPAAAILDALVSEKQPKTAGQLEYLLKKAGWLDPARTLEEIKAGSTSKGNGTAANDDMEKFFSKQGVSREQAMTQLLKLLPELPEEDRAFVQSLLLSDHSKDRLPAAIKKQVDHLGLFHEARLQSLQSQEEAVNKSVKSLLLQVLESNEKMTAAFRTQAEKVLHKITGLQLNMLQSQENVQQVLLQLPMMLGIQAADLTVRWEGKKTETGEIDSDFCRILFILQLENMKETTVGVTIQNRILSLQIWNGQEKANKIPQDRIEMLRESLKQIDYHLSGVMIMGGGKERPALAKSAPEPMKGVDLRI
ncbi:hypothetical protein [Fictibacillus sp. KU28468]|uniref:hypothetical protein n=1 Tax=Fictibacillus sp. KU28468 TaxID=2991053 RepID=UPI00223E42D9|nr:hypothetical protein [Fictibacillus sp. KU28468]UZJ77181.1 hypothetical protein OKX00_13370 [Fictibacillus sp. KU28468]